MTATDALVPGAEPKVPRKRTNRAGTIFGRLTHAVREQNWTAIAIELTIVVVGVFLGIQIGNWNDARIGAQRRAQIIDALVTNLSDANAVQRRFVAEIDAGLAEWEAAFANGEQPAPFFYRINGSDLAPDVWTTFEQMQLIDLFDPVTLFDLTFFYSEVEGVGHKYVRYVTFVEEEVLPGMIAGAESFYDANGQLRPRFRANMDRLRDFQRETAEMTRWAECLVYRLEARRTFEHTCRRVDYQLDGMHRPAQEREATP